ncbi:MAG: DUF3524 domain-containing protein, partial [Bacteroidota bacterium]
MKILLLEPFHTGSHADWAKGVVEHSGHEIKLLKLSGKYWKWRMHGGAHQLAREFLNLDFLPDLILASDMLDLGLFLSLTRKKSAAIPTALYFHENQLVYPWSPTDPDKALKRDRHYAFINFSSACVADHIFFNSHYHKEAFFEALPTFLKVFPDYRQLESIEELRAKSEVLALGLNLKTLDVIKGEENEANTIPHIVWNHRWEYDKNPEDFFEVLFRLKSEGVDFRLILLGEQYKRELKIFKLAKEKLSEEIVHEGFAESREAYASLLRKADILPVCSKHDFFGVSVVEAIYAGAYPLLPRRLAYPEHIEFHPPYYPHRHR